VDDPVDLRGSGYDGIEGIVGAVVKDGGGQRPVGIGRPESEPLSNACRRYRWSLVATTARSQRDRHSKHSKKLSEHRLRVCPIPINPVATMIQYAPLC